MIPDDLSLKPPVGPEALFIVTMIDTRCCIIEIMNEANALFILERQSAEFMKKIVQPGAQLISAISPYVTFIKPR